MARQKSISTKPDFWVQNPHVGVAHQFLSGADKLAMVAAGTVFEIVAIVRDNANEFNGKINPQWNITIIDNEEPRTLGLGCNPQRDSMMGYMLDYLTQEDQDPLLASLGRVEMKDGNSFYTIEPPADEREVPFS